MSSGAKESRLRNRWPGKQHVTARGRLARGRRASEEGHAGQTGPQPEPARGNAEASEGQGGAGAWEAKWRDAPRRGPGEPPRHRAALPCRPEPGDASTTGGF